MYERLSYNSFLDGCYTTTRFFKIFPHKPMWVELEYSFKKCSSLVLPHEFVSSYRERKIERSLHSPSVPNILLINIFQEVSVWNYYNCVCDKK